jgi:hypothetical protein
VAERDDLIEDSRQFTREILTRFDRTMRDARAEWRAQHQKAMAELRVQREESRQYFESIWAEVREHRRQTDELIEENRAQRKALFAILDRLGDGGGAAPAT